MKVKLLVLQVLQDTNILHICINGYRCGFYFHFDQPDPRESEYGSGVLYTHTDEYGDGRGFSPTLEEL